jgi:hypothetical protein
VTDGTIQNAVWKYSMYAQMYFNTKPKNNVNANATNKQKTHRNLSNTSKELKFYCILAHSMAKKTKRDRWQSGWKSQLDGRTEFVRPLAGNQKKMLANKDKQTNTQKTLR